MAKQYFSPRNIKFLLHEMLNASELSQFDYYKEHDRESFDMVLDAAKQIGDNILHPTFVEMDDKEPELENGKVEVHPAVKDYLKAMGEAGMIGSSFPFEAGGQQLPHLIESAMSFILAAANNAPTMYTGLTTGSARLIMSFGSQELKDAYLPKMLNGTWQGTMCLTEPQAGSSLSDITSSATPADNNSYKIKGQKIFISAGDHDQCDNFVHLVLARIDGAPLGTKGISLFVVPKFRLENGNMVDNDVISSGIFHKMGQKATPAMHLAFGDKEGCYGWLVGEANQGLKYMFQMMNEARLGVGLLGASVASAAYYASLEYALERPQGRRIDNKEQKAAPQSLIIRHADVRRMLLFQKSVVEGSLGLLFECAKYADLEKVTEGDEKEKYTLLLDLLTPIAKTFPSEYGIKSVNEGMQVFGGYGYCKDFPLEQMARDIRITSIYEGTTGIQSMDLLGRKITMKGGKAVMVLAQEIQQTLADAMTFDDLKKYAEQLQKEMGRFQQVTQHLVGFAMKGEAERFLADANLFMEFSSLIVVSWQWLKQAIVAKRALVGGNAQGDDEVNFYESKVHTMRYFFSYELPKVKGLATRLLDEDLITIVQDKELLV